jgi:CRP/FNR family cyclic AMP-dependent transcriptional regulator
MLQNVECFKHLSAEELAEVEACAVLHSYPKDRVIVNKGDEANALYVLIEGELAVYLTDDEEGRGIVLNTLQPGDYFGELGLLGEEHRTASVKSLSQAKVASIERAAFLEFIAERPEFALDIIRNLVKRVSALSESVGDLALLDVYRRVVKLLQAAAQPDASGDAVTGRLTQQDIADRVGASREMVSRILNELRKGDYVSIERKRVTLKRKLPERW